MNIKLLVIAACVCSLSISSGVFAQEEPWCYIKVRKDLGDGKGVRDHDAVIKLRTKNDGVGFGTATRFTAAVSNKLNCAGNPYEYVKVTIDENWEGIVIDENTGMLTNFRCGPADLEAYWNDVYEGYEKLSGVDFTKNCHGYAFDVGDWPAEATLLLNLGPFAQIPGRACWETSELKDAKIASLPPSHSIKVVGGTCTITQPPGPVPVVPGQPGQPAIKQVIKETKQKFRESGVYRQTANCPESVDLNQSRRLKNINFNFYKPKN
ncbi:MAG: hypothetical protein ACK49R_16165 [Planctomycetota bacterium]|jgi:hypothetical protein